MSDRDQAFCSKLVEAVNKHPCLYNYSLPDYSNKILVEEVWAVVVREVYTSCKSILIYNQTYNITEHIILEHNNL